MNNDINANGEGAELDIDLDEEHPDGGSGAGNGEGGDKDKGTQKPKSDETPEARSARLNRMADQHDKKYGLGKYAKKDGDEPSNNNKPTELDYAQKAFLISNGIKGKEETELVQTFMKETGKSLDDILESPYFQSELNALREAKATGNAIPKGSKRSGNLAADSVEYWLAKGELPPADQVDLRRKVVNAKIAQKSSGNVFTSTPVVE